MEAAGTRYIVHPSRSDRFKIWNICDGHLGTKACAESKLQADIEHIRGDPYSFFVGTGDNGDFISMDDKRFDPTVLAGWITKDDLKNIGHAIATRIRDTFAPIKDKCLGLGYGNHEDKYMQHKDQTQKHGWICEELGVPNLHYSAFFDIVFLRYSRIKKPRLYFELPDHLKTGFERHSFRFFVHHGAGASTTPGGKLNRLIKFMNSFDADVYMVGHVHDQKGQKKVTIGANGNCTDLVAKKSVGIISGSYLRTYTKGITTYGERAGYEATVLGASFASIHPETRDIRGEI